MNIVPILCLLFVATKAAVLKQDSQVESESGLGENGIQNSFLDSINPGHNGEPISGQFVYTGEDGQLYEVFYFADVYGYQAQGRVIGSNHPLADSLKRWNTKITLEGKYGTISD